jgi:hypothetical protein
VWNLLETFALYILFRVDAVHAVDTEMLAELMRYVSSNLSFPTHGYARRTKCSSNITEDRMCALHIHDHVIIESAVNIE